MKIEDLGQVRRLVILLYGKPMVGKTLLASQFPQPHFIELDGKMGSVLTAYSRAKKKFSLTTFEIDDAPTTDPDFIALCGESFAKQNAWLKTKKLTEMLLKTLPQDATLIVDSITKLSKVLMDFISRTTGHKPLQLQDYNMFTIYLQEYIDMLRGSLGKCNVILIGHEDIIKDETTGAIERVLYIPTKARYSLPAMADEYWRLVVKPKVVGGKAQNVRYLQTTPDRITASGSSIWLPDIEEPTYGKIRPYLEKGLGRKFPEPNWDFSDLT